MEEQERRLYPVKFIENDSKTAWGEVSYKIADLGFVDSMVSEGWFGGNTLSELMGTYMERVTGDDAFEYYGLQFPLTIKVLKTSGWQPLQVSVGDGPAEERYDSFGKTTLWYITEASEGAAMYLGVAKDLTAEEFYLKSQDGTLKEVLNEIHPKAGDSILIKPGTVFAAGPGLTIVEISECSELTFNIHNWGLELPEGEELLLEEAFDLIDFKAYMREDDIVDNEILAKRDEFTVKKMTLRNPLHIFSEQPGGFALYHCLSGEADFQPGPGAERFDTVVLKAGQTVLVPSETNDFFLLPVKEGTTLLEAVVERRVDPDSYTGSTSNEENTDPHIRNWN